MKEISVSTFDELKEQVDELLSKFGRHEFAGYSQANQVVFRGQADSDWELKSTLERTSSRDWTLRRYLRLADRIRPIIESYYPLPFSNPSKEEVDRWLRDEAQPHGIFNMPSYNYLLYLRHHGFPSPFVDWTTSLYIATGFAFFRDNAADNKAVFMYIDTINGGKGGWEGDPEIHLFGHYVKTHKRHFLQQARYTICFNRTNETIPLEKYSKVVSGSEDREQDLLWKFIIPSSERESILRSLMSVNISPFSLMPSRENLMDTLWLNEEALPEFDRLKYNKKN